jgi:hypothetical protein
MNPKSFFGELKRRNVYKVAVAYAIVGGLSIQIATQVFSSKFRTERYPFARGKKNSLERVALS